MLWSENQFHARTLLEFHRQRKSNHHRANNPSYGEREAAYLAAIVIHASSVGTVDLLVPLAIRATQAPRNAQSALRRIVYHSTTQFVPQLDVL